jgi:hypothetical protein
MNKIATFSFFAVLLAPALALASEAEQTAAVSGYDPFTVKLLVVTTLAAIGTVVFTRKKNSLA